MHNLIVIAGPTAIGKSSTAIELAKKINAQIISVDCYQCYKYMDIGTAKATEEQLNKVKHFMVSEYEPTESLSVFEYAQKSKEIIKERIKHNDIILVGGSGLYIDSIVFDNYNFDECSTDTSYRTFLQKYAEENGKSALYEKLCEIDPDYAQTTHCNNIKRVIRALEYYHTTGKKMSENKTQRKLYYDNTKYFVLSLDRAILYPRINLRVDEMMDSGLLEEVKYLYEKYSECATQAFKAIGYAELISYLKGEISLENAVELIKQHTRNYAKRQYTWFRANNFARFVTLDGDENASDIANIIYGEL